MPKLRPAQRTMPLAPEVQEIPIGVRRLASWSWRLLIITAAAALLLWLATRIATILIPVLIATLLTVMLMPLVKILMRYTFLGRTAAAGVALLSLVIVIAGMFTLAGRQLIASWTDIQMQAVNGFQTVMNWVTATFQIDTPMMDQALDQALAELQENLSTILDSAVSTVSVLGNFATGIVVTLFALFFMLASGPTIWLWIVGLLPPQARVKTHESFRRGWKALSAYVQTQILVAGVDATGIAIGMAALGLGSYAVPIWLLVFLFSFIPLIGAIVSGAIAILLVLVLKGWVFALIMLAVVLAVQQLEGNVLQPFLMGKAVSIHPLAVFLGVAVGASVASIAGALFAIPVIAFINATMLHMVGRDPNPELGTDEAARAHFEALLRRPYVKPGSERAAAAGEEQSSPASSDPAAGAAVATAEAPAADGAEAHRADGPEAAEGVGDDEAGPGRA